jgi:hypothetical protein
MVRAAALILVLISAPAVSAPKKDPNSKVLSLLDRPASELEPLVTVTGDYLDPEIKVTTRGVIAPVVKMNWLSSSKVENSFLRGFINRKTGKVATEVYHVATYTGRGWHHFNRASFEGPNGLVEAPIVRLGSDVSCGRYSCTYQEDVSFPVDFEVLKAAAAAYDPANPRLGLKYRLFGQSGTNTDEAIPINEIAAFVAVMERQQR